MRPRWPGPCVRCDSAGAVVEDGLPDDRDLALVDAWSRGDGLEELGADELELGLGEGQHNVDARPAGQHSPA